MLGPQDVGQRVVVRRIVGVRDGRPLFSDVLGQLTSIDGSTLIVERDGRPVRIPLPQVSAAKRVPPRAHRRTGRPVPPPPPPGHPAPGNPTDAPVGGERIAALERLASDVWPAPERARLGEWELRAAAGWTGRANSALPIGDPGMPLPDAIDAVTAWYRERNLPARINVPRPLAGPLDALLDGAGWGRSPLVLVRGARREDVLAALPDPATLPPVRLDRTPSPEWLALVTSRKNYHGDHPVLPPAAYHVLTTGDPPAVEVVFAAVYEAGAPVAIGRGALRDGHLHLGLLEVAEGARRRGLARHVTRALITWAAAAHTVFLQVEAHNTAAVALYAGMGLRTWYTYTTRTAPSA